MVLTASGVRHVYGSRCVLHAIDLEVPAGVVVGVVGENGAGKTTLLRILSGELTPTGGTVTRAGSFGYCPQRVVLNEALTVAQHLRFFQVAYELPNLWHAEHLMDLLDYREYRDDRVGVLSGGTRQKLNLTIALMHDPDLLLLDEPYQGFDWDTYVRFWELTAHLRANGRSVLVISHLAHDTQHFDQLHHLRKGALHAASDHTRGR
jgi:ABC-2 type transport system ATP-binding protein